MTTQNETRLDRAERSIEHLAEITDKLIAANAKQIAANSKQIAALSKEIGFLLAAVKGHVSQATPPAHQD